MKVIAINGSPNKKGNTFHALNEMGKVFGEEGIEFEILQTGHMDIHGCIGCGGCVKNRDEKCVLPDDGVNELIQRIKKADGIVFGSPVYYSGIPGTLKSFLDRLFYVAGVNGSLFRHKVGASVVAVRRSGGLPTFQQLNNYLLYSEMVIASSNYWNVIHGSRPGEVLEDEEGLQILRILAKNMIWIMRLVENGKDKVIEPDRERKIFTNFIR